MCGIFGQFVYGAGQHGFADSALVAKMAQALAHRGPDGYGLHTDPRGLFAFGAGRLAIIDLQAPPGILFNEDKTVAVAFNGEIYNHRTLRQSLEAAGHQFATKTDTEVIVHGYEQWGASVVEKLHGMFAIAIWSQAEQQLLLVRDRLGEKPLYYADLEGQLLFASEAKALFQHPKLRPAVNREALPFYLTLGYTPPPQTLFAGISKLAPGQMLRLRAGHKPHLETYWQASMKPAAAKPIASYEAAVSLVRKAITQSVEARLMSDVPFGAFLSGGVDSSAVVGLMSAITRRPVQTFTVGYATPPIGQTSEADQAKFNRKFNADSEYAALVAQTLATEHQAVNVPQDERLAWLLPHLIYAMDEPVSQPGIILTAYVAALARRCNVPVLLSGDASDELFAGYPAYKAAQQVARYRRLHPLLRKGITPLLAGSRSDRARKLAEKSTQERAWQHYTQFMNVIVPERVPALLANQNHADGQGGMANFAGQLETLLARPQTKHFADRMAYAGLRWWVAEDSNMRVDKMSMAMSIEARAPFQDHQLAELALNLPLEYKLRGGDFKKVLKDAVAEFVPNQVLQRPKWGFFPPASAWLRTCLRPLVETYLSPEYVAAVGIFDVAAVGKIVAAHMAGHYELWAVWTLLVFHMWHALYISGDLVLAQKVTPADLAN
jgi:asparagine synthase (glutamine-hydrolysing)